MKPILSTSLSVILPTPDQTMLLRAWLLAGDQGRAAWRSWRAKVNDPVQALRSDGQALKPWLPLFYHTLRVNGVTADQPFQTVLRTSYLREQLRRQAFQSVLKQTLSSLVSAGLDFIVLKGAALAETVYPIPALRHCHDVDLLVRHGDLERVAGAGLSGLRADRRTPTYVDDLAFVHESGLPLQFHTHLFRLSYYEAPPETWGRASSSQVAGVEARVLSPELSLLHVCGHASCSPSRESLAWVCDSVSLIHANPQLDWDLFCSAVIRSRLALPMTLMLSYLAEQLDVPIPERVRERLAGVAAQTDTVGREVALYGARTSTRGNLKSLVQNATTWRERMMIAKWVLLPSPRALQIVRPLPSAWLLPAYYAYRPLQYLRNRARTLHA